MEGENPRIAEMADRHAEGAAPDDDDAEG